MKVLLDLERLRYPNSGLANVMRNIAMAFEEKESLPFIINYFAPKEKSLDFISDSKIITYRKWHKFLECFSKNYDVIHISHQGSLYFRKNYKNAIKILTLHDLNFLHEDLPPRKKRRLLDRVNASLRYVDYIVCISEFVKQDFLKNKHLFTLEKLKDILVIYNGIELPKERKYDLGRFCFLGNKKYILNIGVLFAKKNQKSIVEMLPHLEEDLVLVASGEKEPYATEVREKITALNLEHKVHFLKNISEEEKYALIQHCQAMCHPSSAEGFGIPPIEAMAFGKPVFLSKLTSLPEIGGDFAFYFDDLTPEHMAEKYKKKMDFYYSNQETMSADIKKWAEQFNKERMGQKYLELYDKVLNG